MKAEPNAEVMGVVLDSPGPIKSDQCVDIMVLADSWRRKIVRATSLVCMQCEPCIDRNDRVHITRGTLYGAFYIKRCSHDIPMRLMGPIQVHRLVLWREHTQPSYTGANLILAFAASPP